jgi:hypothetical protein
MPEVSNSNPEPQTLPASQAAPEKFKVTLKQSPAEIEAEIKALELESKRLAVMEQKLNLEDIQQRLDERQLKRETIRSTSLTNGATLKQLAQNELAVQKRCNHKKGGNGVAGIIGGQGDSPDYAVIKHTFCNGDMWVRCQRCGKTWKPPLLSQYKTVEEYNAASAQYETAKEFQTKNTSSSSTQFRFSDNGAYYREVTKDSNLR